MSNDFKRIVEAIHSDAEPDCDEAFNNESVFISEETDKTITIYDYTDAPFEHVICYTDTETMTKEWLKQKIIILTSAANNETVKPYLDNMVNWIFSVLPKECYQTLNRLVFCSYTDEDGYERDNEELSHIQLEDWHLDFYELLESHDLPDYENCLGITWEADNIVVINVGHVKDCVDKMLKAEEILDDEYNREIFIALHATIAHEFRHLEQNDPYVSEETFNSFLSDPEEDAEEFAHKYV